MKKYLVFSVIFLTSFLLISNVKASSVGALNIDKSLFDNNIQPISNLNNGTEILNKLLELNKYDSNTMDYMCVGKSDSIDCVVFPKNKNFEKKPGLSFNGYNGSSNLILFFYIQGSSDSTYAEYGSSTGYSYKGKNNYINIFTNYRISGTVKNKVYQFTGNENIIYFSSSIDLYFSEYEGFGYHFEPIFINEDDVCLKQFNINDVIYTSDSLNIKPQTPEITFKEVEKGYEDETKTKLLFHKIGINFSIYDTEKYIYFYRTSLQNDKTWNSISNNDFEYTAFSDQTLYVAIIDRQKYEESAENGQELVFDYIATATYTFDKLSSTIPELSFNANIPDSCYMTINGKKETVCKNLNIKISNYNDLNKYLWEYSIGNSENFKPTYSDKFTLYLDDNVTIYFRLLDREKNEYIKYATYKMAGISQNISSIGPYVNLHGEYKEKEYYYEVTVYYYNYDSNLYNYYYSVDREKWTEINPIDLSIYSSNSTNKTYYNQYKVYQDCTFYLKIEDKNGNFVKAATLTIDSFGKNNTPKNILQNIKSIFDGKTGIFNKVNEIYSIIRNSKVGIYIFIVISGSIIILLIKGIRS